MQELAERGERKKRDAARDAKQKVLDDKERKEEEARQEEERLATEERERQGMPSTPLHYHAVITNLSRTTLVYACQRKPI